MIVALAATPAAACAALCMPGKAHSEGRTTADATVRHDTHGSVRQSAKPASTDESPASASGHHHSLSQNGEPSQTPYVAASDRTCCTSADSAVRASLAASRADTGALLATASAEIPTAFHSQISLRGEPGYSPPVAPPSPTRAPLVLRV